MKRIILLAVMLVVVGISATRAYDGYVPLRYRARYSPYVGGLVPGCLRYSPYAFDYHHSGLVSYQVRYSPYAFNHSYPSGLIDVYSGYPYLPPYDCPPPIIVQPPKAPDYQKARRIEKPREPREKDGKEIIYNYLKSKGLDVDIVDGFCFQNHTVDVVFLIRSKNLFIRYQNPELARSLEANSLWGKYKKKWEQREKEYKATGWKFGNIMAE